MDAGSLSGQILTDRIYGWTNSYRSGFSGGQILTDQDLCLDIFLWMEDLWMELPATVRKYKCFTARLQERPDGARVHSGHPRVHHRCLLCKCQAAQEPDRWHEQGLTGIQGQNEKLPPHHRATFSNQDTKDQVKLHYMGMTEACRVPNTSAEDLYLAATGERDTTRNE